MKKYSVDWFIKKLGAMRVRPVAVAVLIAASLTILLVFGLANGCAEEITLHSRNAITGRRVPWGNSRLAVYRPRSPSQGHAVLTDGRLAARNSPEGLMRVGSKLCNSSMISPGVIPLRAVRQQAGGLTMQAAGAASGNFGREKVSTSKRDGVDARRGRAVGLVKSPAQSETTTSFPWTSAPKPESLSRPNAARGPFADRCSLHQAERRSEQKADPSALNLADGGGSRSPVKACNSDAHRTARHAGSIPAASTICRVEKQVSRQAHNLKVSGSSPDPATNSPPPLRIALPARMGDLCLGFSKSGGASIVTDDRNANRAREVHG